MDQVGLGAPLITEIESLANRAARRRADNQKFQLPKSQRRKGRNSSESVAGDCNKTYSHGSRDRELLAERTLASLPRSLWQRDFGV